MDKEQFPIFIERNKAIPGEKQCKMTYRNKTIKYFPVEYFDLEYESIFLMIYKREMIQIDEFLKR